MDEVVIRIGKLIREKRLEKGYTIQQLAENLGVSVGLISNIENAKTDAFNLILLINLCNILDISLFTFLLHNANDLKNSFDINNIPNEVKQHYDKITDNFIDAAIKVNYDKEKLNLLTDNIISNINLFKKLIE